MSSEHVALFRPIAVTDAVLTSSTVAEPATVTDADPALWNAATNYAVGDRVSRLPTHMIYQRLAPGGVDAASPESDTTKWTEVGPTNRWCMFDAANESQTTAAESIGVVLTPGAMADCIAFDNVAADSIRVQVAGTSYDQTITLKSRMVRSWWDFFVEPFRYKTGAVFSGLPALVGNVITVTISKPGGTAKCGTCVIGLRKSFGYGPDYGASIGIIDYSRKVTNAFGRTTVVERSYSKRMDLTVWVDADRVDEIRAMLAGYRATPVVWVGAGNAYDSLIVYGYYRSFEIVIPYDLASKCNLEIEGLT